MSFLPKDVNLQSTTARGLTRKPADINFNGFLVLPHVKSVSERIGYILKQQQVGVLYRHQVTINSLFPCPKEQDDSDHQRSGIKCTKSVAHSAVLYTMVKQRDHSRLELWSTERQGQVLTKTPKLLPMSINQTTRWILKTLRLLDLFRTLGFELELACNGG